MSEKKKDFRIEIKHGDDQIFYLDLLPEKIIAVWKWLLPKKEREQNGGSKSE